jgi:hypothetical protein
MNVAVIGTGYVGLVTGTVFADLGNEVICVDKVEEKVEMLKAGKAPIYEPGLEEMLAHNIRDGRLSFTTDLDAAVKQGAGHLHRGGHPPATGRRVGPVAGSRCGRGHRAVAGPLRHHRQQEHGAGGHGRLRAADHREEASAMRSSSMSFPTRSFCARGRPFMMR